MPSQAEIDFVERVSQIVLLVEAAGDLDTLLRLDRFKHETEECIDGIREFTPRRYGGRNDDPHDNAMWETIRHTLLTDPRMVSVLRTMRRGMQEQIMEQLETAAQ